MPENHTRDNAFRRAARGVFWGGFAAISVIMAYQLARTEGGTQRLAQARGEAVELAGIYRDMRAGGSAPTQLAASSGSDSAISGEVEILRNRLALLEDQLGAVTGSLRTGNVPQQPAFSVLSPMPEEARNDPFTPKTGADARIMHTGFALALATGTEIAALEQTWAALKGKYPNELNSLSPQVQLDRNTGKTTLLLLAGPLGNARDAARLCARLRADGDECHTVPLSGPTIALNSGQG